MLDTAARRVLGPPLTLIARRLDAAHVTPIALTASGWFCGVGACIAIGADLPYLALILWLANRLLDGLDGPLARLHGATDLGGFLDIVADFSVYSGFVIAIAVAHPSARLACVALLCAYYVSGTAFLGLSSILSKRGDDLDDGRSLRFVGGLAEGTETVIVYGLFCLLSDHSRTIAWIFTIAVGITALQRIVIGTRLLSRPAATRPRPTTEHRARDRPEAR